MFKEFSPYTAGASINPFFLPGKPSTVIPSSELRELPPPLDRMPVPLRELFSKFPPNVEFYDGKQWRLMSENEILSHYALFVACGQCRILDVGFAYAGMGHVKVLAVDTLTGLVFEQMDGGSNDWDRHANHTNRVTQSVDDLTTFPFHMWLLEKDVARNY